MSKSRCFHCFKEVDDPNEGTASALNGFFVTLFCDEKCKSEHYAEPPARPHRPGNQRFGSTTVIHGENGGYGANVLASELPEFG